MILALLDGAIAFHGTDSERNLCGYLVARSSGGKRWTLTKGGRRDDKTGTPP
jgi:hypothetical protein